MSNTLFVPIELKAMVVNDMARKGQNFQRWSMNYTNLESYASPMPQAFSGNNASNWNNDPSANGVYLHWTLPHALRTGNQNSQAGTTDYPLVPNRWLVVRYSGSGDARTADAWVVESDFLDANGGASPYIDPNSKDNLAVTRMGRKVAIDQWKEQGAGDLFLTAVGTGDLTFAAYQPYGENVFSIHDTLDGVEDQATLSYMVAGWYSDPSKDILASATDLAAFQALLDKFNWQSNATQPCTLSVCHGLTLDLQWDKTGPIPQSDRPQNTDNVHLAVGNTSIDALTALIGEQDHTLDTKLLEAFQYNLLPVLDQPSGPDLLNQAIHKAWFGSYQGGYRWVITKDPADQGGGDPQVPYPDASVDWNDSALSPSWLSVLNQTQEKYDQTLRALADLRWRLYSLWWTKGRFDNAGAQNQQALAGLDSDFTDSGFDTQLADLGKQVQETAQTAAGLAAQLPKEGDVQSYAQQHGLPKGYQLKRFGGAPFYKANDPVILVSGSKASGLLYDDTPLPCRTQDQLVAGLTFNGTAVTVDSMAGKIPTGNLSSVPAAMTSLVQEFFFLDPEDATLIAATALKNSDPQTIQALQEQIAAHTGMTGTLPALDLSPWQQPWAPLFLLWTVFYYPIGHDTDGDANWTFDGGGYQLADKHLPLTGVTPLTLNGITTLSPQSSFNFKKRLETFQKNHPDLDADELKALDTFITDTDQWDFLSQTLDGFSFQLACRDPESNLVPAAGSQTGQLVQGQTSTVPQLGGFPQPFQGWPDSNFQPYRAGQFCFEKLMVVDRFGQSVEVATSKNYQEIKPAIAPDMVPPAGMTVLDQEPYRFIQLSPRLLQPARLDFDFVSATDDTKIIDLHSDVNPVCAWILPNHIDRSLACYSPEGFYLGQLEVTVDDKGQHQVHWEPAPGTASTPADITTHYPHLGQMLTALIAKGTDAFTNFYQTIDETLWTVDPLGGRDDTNLSVLVGRPLALTRARLRFELDGPAYTDPSWEYVFKAADPQFTGYTFPVKLGQRQLANDGLIGYFTGGDYDQFNTVHLPTGGSYVPVTPPYVVQVGVGNFLDLTFQESSETFVSMLIDPRAAVHATTSILPVTLLELPTRFVEPALGAMEVMFHAGPLLSGSSTQAAEGGDQLSILMPKPAEKNGQWNWLTQTGGQWNDGSPLGQVSQKALFSNVSSILRTGVLKLSGALGNSPTHPLMLFKENPMSHTENATNQGLLAYAITTSPEPIQASPAEGNPSLTSLVITVSNNSMKPIYCNKLGFSFSIGDLAQNLTATGAGILASANPSDKWQISMTGEGMFTATPTSPDNNLITTEGLAFQIYNIQANTQVGTFTLNVAEDSSNDNKNFSPKNNAFQLAKFPYGFYVNHFAATTPMVSDGETVTLTWSGSDLGTYTILYADKSVDVTDVRSWTSPPLTQTTTFALRAGMQEQGETVDTYLYVTVIVSSPEIRCTSLTATGEIQGVGMTPPGSILMQSGSLSGKFDSNGAGLAATPYQGWQICNGQNGAPNLQDQFIVGAGNQYQEGNTGGNQTIALSLDQMPTHNHGVNDPGHSHSTWLLRDSSTDVDDDSLPMYARNNASVWNTGSSYTGISIQNTGGGQPFDNRPPYYALYYIMRVGS